jgi:hypothetical protein
LVKPVLRTQKIVIYAVLFYFIFLQGQASCAQLSSEDFLWLEQGETAMERDGSLTQKIYLKSKNNKFSVDDMSEASAIYYCQTRSGLREAYILPIQHDNGTYYVKAIAKHRNNYCEVVVSGYYKNVFYTAQNLFTLYADAFDKDKKPSLITAENKEHLPYIFAQTKNRVRTGQPLEFIYKSPEKGVADVHIFEKEKGFLTALKTNEDGCFSYTAPDDDYLDKMGNSAYRTLIISVKGKVADKTSINTLSFPLYRDYNGRVDEKQAFVLFIITFLIAVIGVLYYRRRFKLK